MTPTRLDVSPAALRVDAIEVAAAAAALVRARRIEVFGSYGAPRRAQATVAVASKSTETDPVTIVDTEAEAELRSLLARRRPGEPVLGEEEGGATAAPTGVRWILDPIDGTVNFLYGVPAYAVSVGVQVDGISVAGAVADVTTGAIYSAAAGQGATVTTAAGEVIDLAVTEITDPALALVATGFGYAAERRAAQAEILTTVLPAVRDIRRVGSAALDLCMVAAGRVDVHFEHGLSPWDWAAGALIAAEAGAIVRVPPADSRGSDGHITVAAAPGIAVAFDELLRSAKAFRQL